MSLEAKTRRVRPLSRVGHLRFNGGTRSIGTPLGSLALRKPRADTDHDKTTQNAPHHTPLDVPELSLAWLFIECCSPN